MSPTVRNVAGDPERSCSVLGVALYTVPRRPRRPDIVPPTEMRTPDDVATTVLTVRIPGLHATSWFEHEQDFARDVVYAQIGIDDDQTAGLFHVAFRRPLSPKELRAIPWQRVIDEAYKDMIIKAVTGRRRHELSGEARTVVTEAAHNLAQRAHKSRRRLTPELLQEVADIVKHGDGPEAVADTMFVSQRQANRYIARAKQDGYLP